MSPRIATRGSRLALIQARRVAAALRAADPAASEPEIVVVETEGDRRQDVELHAIGGRGVFVKEVQQAVLDGRADLAVHSAKDLPSETPAGLALASVPERLDPRDALVGARFADLPTGARVATGSVRRRAQLAAARPDLVFAPLRGNLDTRLARAADHDAVVVALAALDRLGGHDGTVDPLDPDVVLPQVGQGALAVECRDDDRELRARLGALETPAVRAAVDAERSFLAGLGGGCDVPCAALAASDGETVTLDAALASLDGHVVLRVRLTGPDPVAAGAAAARDLLDGAGGRALLEGAS